MSRRRRPPLTASTGIGSSSNRLEIEVSTLIAETKSSSAGSGIYLNEKDDITLSDVKTKNGNIDVLAENGTITETTVTAGGGSVTLKDKNDVAASTAKVQQEVDNAIQSTYLNVLIEINQELTSDPNPNSSGCS